MAGVSCPAIYLMQTGMENPKDLGVEPCRQTIEQVERPLY